MFVVVITYKAPLEVIDKYLIEHREFLTSGYEQNFLLASGPQKPRVGGILISQLKNKEQLNEFLSKDPFMFNNLADYEVLEFDPVKHHSCIGDQL